MSFIAARKRSAAVLVVALALWAAMAAAAMAANNSTITRADCESGRISRHGKAVSKEECLRHVGQSVQLAHTGFDVWIVALAGGACLAGAAALRLRPRFRGTHT